MTTGGSARAIQFSQPSNPPANAVGWVPYLTSLGSGEETLQVPDGLNTICGDGSQGNYVANLPYGQACALSAPSATVATIIYPTDIKTPTVHMNASGAFVALGGQSGIQTQLSNGQYASRIENLTIECGQGLNNIAPYTVGVYNAIVEEQSGPFYTNINDCASGGIYIFSAGAQNSSARSNHMAGQNWDYTKGITVDSVAAFRGLEDFSLNGPAQGTQWTSVAGADIFTDPLLPQGSSTTVANVECEACFDSIAIANTSVSILNNSTTTTPGRHSRNAVHIKPWSYDVTVAGNFGNSACAVQNDVNRPTACTSSQTSIGFYAFGNVGGTILIQPAPRLTLIRVCQLSSTTVSLLALPDSCQLITTATN